MKDTKMDLAMGPSYRIMRLLLDDPKKRWYLEEIGRSIQLPKMTIHRALERLGRFGIIESKRTKYRRFWWMRNSHSTRALRVLMNVDNALVAEIVDHFKASTLVLYGSRAKGTNGPESDWDILVIDDGADPLEINAFVNHLEAKYGVKVDMRSYTRKGFDRIRSDKTPYYMEILSGMYVLRGDPIGP